MKKSMKEIDDIVRNKLMNYEEEPSPNLWRRLSERLFRSKLINGLFFLFIILFGFFFWLMMPKPFAENTEMQNSVVTDVAKVFVAESVIKQNTETYSIHDLQEKDKAEINNNRIIDSIKEVEKAADSDKDDNQQFEQIDISKNQNVDNIEVPVNDVLLERRSRIHLITSKPIDTFFYGEVNEDLWDKENDNTILINSLTDVTNSSRFSISLEYGRAFTWKRLQSEAQYQDFKRYRMNHEESVINSLFGVRFNYHYKNWVFSSGLEYVTIGEKLNYDITKVVVNPEGGYFHVDPIYVTTFDQENNVIPMLIGYESTWVEAYKNEYSRVDNTNRYSYIEIPFLIGYRFKQQKITFQPFLGMTCGFLYAASGKWPQMNSADFTEINKHSGYLTKVNYNVTFNLNLEYQMTPNYGLFISPFYKKGLNSIYRNYMLSGTYNTFGVKMGINIYL
ncbi:MAG: hypothetical protein WC341_04265 [Bacteroidales bacterium]|jgi:hypothetical protein